MKAVTDATNQLCCRPEDICLHSNLISDNLHATQLLFRFWKNSILNLHPTRCVLFACFIRWCYHLICFRQFLLWTFADWLIAEDESSYHRLPPEKHCMWLTVNDQCHLNHFSDYSSIGRFIWTEIFDGRKAPQDLCRWCHPAHSGMRIGRYGQSKSF